ncbi:hypothetical protein AM587_10002414 [Phytophthora nicotianae]|uniref:Uncharacterized protein n=1 Tax=Phytophthora nicotianae TaxID=4792 RepID=A0A0W8E0W1_PHYNI|nr:hypothetical protein AM587_10002403 [Phytophthora nicotianae]KUG02038.1 hypothetical protein AM587_10002414 [Phytophthora nicotianae]
MSREVYFQLVDKATRLPLPDTFVDAVDLVENASVIRFRRAVWDQVKSILPSNVIAANLRVYADEAAYKAKKQCSPRSSLNELDAQATLIVEVPTQRLTVPVVPQKILRIGVDSRYADKISSYMKIAERLKDGEEVRSLSWYVAKVIEEGKSQNISTPFIVLENSSGTGKTQMAFNLQARGDCDVFYIVCGNPGDREQTVYDAYAERMSVFQRCVLNDLDALKRVTLGNQVPLGAVGQIRGQTTLSLYGFILAALRGQDVYYGETQRSDVMDELEKRGSKPFVFFWMNFHVRGVPIRI